MWGKEQEQMTTIVVSMSVVAVVDSVDKVLASRTSACSDGTCRVLAAKQTSCQGQELETRPTSCRVI